MEHLHPTTWFQTDSCTEPALSDPQQVSKVAPLTPCGIGLLTAIPRVWRIHMSETGIELQEHDTIGLAHELYFAASSNSRLLTVSPQHNVPANG